MGQLGFPEPEYEPAPEPSAADLASMQNVVRHVEHLKHTQVELETRMATAPNFNKKEFTIPGHRKKMQEILSAPKKEKAGPEPLKRKKAATGRRKHHIVHDDGNWSTEVGANLFTSIEQRTKRNLAKTKHQHALCCFRQFFEKISNGMPAGEILELLRQEILGMPEDAFRSYFRVEVMAALRAFRLIEEK